MSKLHSGMTCEKRVKPTAKDEVIESCDPHSETLMLIANLAARIKENA